MEDISCLYAPNIFLSHNIKQKCYLTVHVFQRHHDLDNETKIPHDVYNDM